MAENYNNLINEMIKLLRQQREKAHLTQREIAQRLGFSAKSGKMYISALERGKKENPSIDTILKYLRVCGSSWVEFFKELDRIDFKMRHEKMISRLPEPPSQRKIERDAMRYEIGVEFPSKAKEEFDFTRLKKRIKDKVEMLVSKEENTLTPALSHQGRGGEEGNHKGRGGEAVMTAYQKFASEFFDFLAVLNKPGQKMVIEKYQRAGYERHLLFKITKIIFSVIRGEIKRMESKKPLPTEKQEKMAIGFTRYRIKIEKIEAAVHKVLCELGVQPRWFALYKDFARECYRAFKRYWMNPALDFCRQSNKGGMKPILNQKLTEIINRWIKEGLKEDVLLKVKDVTIKVMESR